MEENTRDYIRRGNSYIRLFVIALILVFLAGTVWGLVGDVPVTNTVQGYVYRTGASDTDGDYAYEVLCFMDASRYTGLLLEGNDAVIKTIDGTVIQSTVSASTELPTTAEDFAVFYDIPQWMLTSLVTGNYMYVVFIDMDASYHQYNGQMVEVSIIVDHKKPFELL